MRMRWIAGAVVVAMAVLGFLAWRNNTQPAAQEPASPSSSMPGDASPEAADPGIAWKVPAGWTDAGGSTMRVAAYSIAGAGDAPPAECAVYYFGEGQGGTPDANIERWLSEFENARDSGRSVRTIHGMRVSLAHARGTYQSHGGSSVPEHGGGAQGDHQLLGAIVEGPRGLVFFKLTGPSATIDRAAADFDRMIGSLRPR